MTNPKRIPDDMSKMELCDEVDTLRAALQGLCDMYARTWDRVDGALVMMPDNIERFEKAHAAAQFALTGKEVNGDASEPPEQRGFVSDELFAIARDCPMSAGTRTKLQALCPRIGELEAFKMHAEKSPEHRFMPSPLLSDPNSRCHECGLTSEQHEMRTSE